MPNCKTHDIITAATTPVVAYVSYKSTNNYEICAIITISYLFASLMFNGDLDIKSRPYNRWLFLKFIWIPYQTIFNHRSIFTHGLIIGTIIRLLYIGIIPLLFILIKGNFNIITQIPLNVLIMIFIGLELGSAVHTISDKIF